MSMVMITEAWKDCEYTQRAKNKAFKGQGAHIDNKDLAIKMLKNGIANNRVEIKTGLSKKAISRYKTDIKRGLM
tara:strand:- start:26953 stop:27174 length:222 start_codon:yes stop_codon:yes gene_type:complete